MFHESQDAQGIYLSIAAWFLEIDLQLSLQSLFAHKVTLATDNLELALFASGRGQGGRVLQVKNSGGDAFQKLRWGFFEHLTFLYIFYIFK